jgi:phenylacetate-CoA ligase
MRWLDTPESWDWIMRLWAMIFEGAGWDGAAAFLSLFLRSVPGILGGIRRGASLRAPGAARRGDDDAGEAAFHDGERRDGRRLHADLCAAHGRSRRAEGIDLAGSSVHSLIVAGEPGGSIPEVRARIEQAWGARVFDHTGMTEFGPLGFECAENPGGMHVMEPEFIAEVIDPESGANPARRGAGRADRDQSGPVGSPLIRYRTGDLVCATPSPAPAGGNRLRLAGGILGRVDSMVFIRGNNLYPAALEGVIRRVRRNRGVSRGGEQRVGNGCIDAYR